jgi:PAS domain S-box-containing protein
MQFLAAIVESSMDAIYGKSLDGRIVSWNPAAELLFGYSAEEIIGQSYARLFPPHRRGEMLDMQAGIRRGDVFGEAETERLHKSGRIIPVAVTVSPVKNSVGEIIGASSITRDISRQKQAEYERQQLIESLMAASKQVGTLAGLLPICASCKRIRDDQGYWQHLEAYISQHSEVTFSPGICPACAEKNEGELQYNKTES